MRANNYLTQSSHEIFEYNLTHAEIIELQVEKNRQRVNAMNLDVLGIILKLFFPILLSAVIPMFLLSEGRLLKAEIGKKESALQQKIEDNDVTLDNLQEFRNYDRIREVAIANGMEYPTEENTILYEDIDSNYVKVYNNSR